MDGKGLGNQLSRYGAIAAILPNLAPSAKVFFVGASGDSWYQDFANEFKPDREGVIRTFSTLNAAMANTVANRGDVILLSPHYTETVTSGTQVTFTAGVYILGLGSGNNRATFTFNNTASKFALAANNVIDNVKFVAGIASIVTAIDMTGKAGCQVKNSVFTASAATYSFLITVLTDTSSIDAVVLNNNFNYSTVTSNMPTECIRLNGADRIEIISNYISGNFSTAAINNITTLCNDVGIQNNEIYNLNSVVTGGIKMLASSTGIISGNTCYTAAASNSAFFTTFISPANCMLGVNTVQNTVGVGGDISAPMGSYVVLQKIITSSSITTSPQDLTTVATGGDMVIENIILETDGTGLAGGTNFQILKNGGEGLAIFMSETVGNLGANKTVDSFSASIAKQRSTIKVGQKLQFDNTVGAGTGGGTIKVTIVLFRAIAGANITVS